MIDTCLACRSLRLEPLADLGQSPVLCGVFWPGEAEARAAAMGRMSLVSCPDCGHAQNEAFDESLVDYDAEYDISLHFSATFQSFADALVERLSATYDLSGGHVVEIGSGKGEFLVDLCARAGALGTGYDPTYAGDSTAVDVTFRREYFPVGGEPPAFDLLVARHVLEHLADPGTFLAGLRKAVEGTRAVVYLEMPSAEFNFSPEGLWDCIYPHVSYFSQTSLLAAVESAGFDVLRLERAFHGQFLAIEIAAPGSGRPRSAVPPADVRATLLDEHRDRLAEFGRRSAAAVTQWRARVAQLASDGEVAMWGAGMKAVVFLNQVDAEGRLRSVVDLNSRKWGRYVPGTAHRIERPESLSGRPLSSVLVTNPAYQAEIAERLQDLGVDTSVVVV